MPSPDAPPRSAAAGAPWLVARVAGYLLFAYGAVGVALQMRLPALILAAGRALAGGSPFYSTPPHAPGTAALVAHFAGQPWAPWAAWLFGLGLLTLAARATPAPPPRPAGAPGPGPVPLLPDCAARRRRILLGLAALLIVLVLRHAPESADATGARPDRAPYDDEGVYAGAGQMVLQGICALSRFLLRASRRWPRWSTRPPWPTTSPPWGSVDQLHDRPLPVRRLQPGLRWSSCSRSGWQVGAAGAGRGPARVAPAGLSAPRRPALWGHRLAAPSTSTGRSCSTSR